MNDERYDPSIKPEPQSTYGIAKIVPAKTDYEIAKEIKQSVIEAYEPLLRLLTEANRKGFQVQVGCGLGPLGNYVIQQLQIVKVFKDE